MLLHHVWPREKLHKHFYQYFFNNSSFSFFWLQTHNFFFQPDLNNGIFYRTKKVKNPTFSLFTDYYYVFLKDTLGPRFLNVQNQPSQRHLVDRVSQIQSPELLDLMQAMTRVFSRYICSRLGPSSRHKLSSNNLMIGRLEIHNVSEWIKIRNTSGNYVFSCPS